jgi:purine-binding chemotaxis protein CheW
MQELTKERERMDDEAFLVGDDDENGQADKYLLFTLGEELYGIAIASVTEIIEMQKITEVPDMPGYIKGVINLRGRVIPVMNLRSRFGMEEKEYDDRTCIVVVEVDKSSMGFIVDTVAEVYDIQEKDIEPAPSFKENEGRGHYISGIGKVENRVTILIDSRLILQEKDQISDLREAGVISDQDAGDGGVSTNR